MKIRGTVLLITLVYIHVLGIMMLQGAAMISRWRQLVRHDRELSIKKREMQMIMRQVDRLGADDCKLPVMDLTQIVRQKTEWWHEHGCAVSDGFSHYFFIREYLVTDACGDVKDNQKQSHAASYYRNTLLYDADISQDQRIFLQDTIVRPAKNPPVCDQVKTIKPGRQMLRWL